MTSRTRKSALTLPPSMHPRKPFRDMLRAPLETLGHYIRDYPVAYLWSWPLIAAVTAPSAWFGALGAKWPGFAVDLARIVSGSALAFGPLLELAQLYLGAHVLCWIGQRFGGRGDASALRTVISWANIPLVYLAMLQFLVFLPATLLLAWLLGEDSGATVPALTALLVISVLAALCAVVASLTFLVRGVAAVHGINGSRGLSVVLVAWLVSVPLLALMLWGLSDAPGYAVLIFGGLVDLGV